MFILSERLNKNEIRILNFLNANDALLRALNGELTKEAIAIKLNIQRTIDESIKKLVSEKLIEIKSPIKGDQTCYAITSKGKDFLEFSKTDKKNQLLWSVFVPFAVTVATNIFIKLLF